jgi:hypothetical protein
VESTRGEEMLGAQQSDHGLRIVDLALETAAHGLVER